MTYASNAQVTYLMIDFAAIGLAPIEISSLLTLEQKELNSLALNINRVKLILLVEPLLICCRSVFVDTLNMIIKICDLIVAKVSRKNNQSRNF